MIICAGNIEQFEFATPTGIGLVETAMNVTRLCLFDKPEFLLFVGTAGSYGSAKLLDVIESKTAANIELSFLQQQAYTPLNNVVSAQTEESRDIIVNSRITSYNVCYTKLLRLWTPSALASDIASGSEATNAKQFAFATLLTSQKRGVR